MAVARAPVGGGMTGIKVALIVFVCLTVASLAFTIILYTHQADLQAAADDATKKVSTANAEVSRMRSDMGEVGRIVTGESGVSELEKFQKTIAAAVQPVLSNKGVAQARIAPDSAIVTVLQKLYGLYQSNAAQLATLTSERDELLAKVKELNTGAEQRAKDFEAKMTEFQSRVSTLEQQNAANQQAWTQQVEDMKLRLERATADASKTTAGERQHRERLEKQLAEARTHGRELADKLARFQPGMDVSPEQIADGRIVRSVPTENIAYIGLGSRDRITPGMPFTVYARPRPGATVHEKANLQVMNVFETTSECRVTSVKPGEPILEGDLVANLVYDRNRQYRFAVAGDFDLNFDGKVDQPGGIGGQDVANMIQRWGGQVAPAVDSSIDFLVLGAPPLEPPKLPAGATEEARQRAADQAKWRQAFDAARNEAKTLSIPVLTRTQFLHMVGMELPPRTPDDQLVAQ